MTRSSSHPAATTRRLIVQFARRAPTPTPDGSLLPVLTDREREVLEQVAAGRSNAEIADLLVVSVPMVKTHVGRLLTKLRVRDRTQQVVLAYETGIVVPGGKPSG